LIFSSSLSIYSPYFFMPPKARQSDTKILYLAMPKMFYLTVPDAMFFTASPALLSASQSQWDRIPHPQVLLFLFYACQSCARQSRTQGRKMFHFVYVISLHTHSFPMGPYKFVFASLSVGLSVCLKSCQVPVLKENVNDN